MIYTFFTINVDWGKSNVAETKDFTAIKEQADIILVQEAKHLNVRSALGRGWQGHQNITNRAKQGVAVAWKLARGIKRHHAVPDKKHHGRFARSWGYVLGVLPNGHKIMARYINYRDLEVNGTTIRFIATHRPPKRFKVLWPLFDRALARFVKASPHPVIIGMDSNTTDHKSFQRLSGLIWLGIGIDGFYLSRVLHDKYVAGSLKAHPKVNSDHHPVSIQLDI